MAFRTGVRLPSPPPFIFNELRIRNLRFIPLLIPSPNLVHVAVADARVFPPLCIPSLVAKGYGEHLRPGETGLAASSLPRLRVVVIPTFILRLWREEAAKDEAEEDEKEDGDEELSGDLVCTHPVCDACVSARLSE